MKITVFTPTYNRADKLTILYNSLKKQTTKGFEWLVVDDGSSDMTEKLINKFINENNDFKIRYYKQENGGKHRAINKGVKLAESELFFIVDSDDWLVDNALERILHHYNNVKDKKEFCGVSGLKKFPTGDKVGGESNFDVLDSTFLEFRYQHKIKGDMAEAYKTSVLKEFKFPDILGEKFCAESYIWIKIAKKYKLRYFYEKIYICEYLENGLSSQAILIRQNNPQYACLTYSDISKSNIPIIYKIKNIISKTFFISNLFNILN